MYDFTKYPIKKKTYSGANGNKIVFISFRGKLVEYSLILEILLER